MLSWAAAIETKWANHAPIWTRINGSLFSFLAMAGRDRQPRRETRRVVANRIGSWYDLSGVVESSPDDPQFRRADSMLAGPVSRHRRRFPRFSMRRLVVVALVIGAGLGWMVRSARIQREAVRAIEKAGGSVDYDWEWTNAERG